MCTVAATVIVAAYIRTKSIVDSNTHKHTHIAHPCTPLSIQWICEQFVEMASMFLDPKIIFCPQTSVATQNYYYHCCRKSKRMWSRIWYTMSMEWTLWKFYVADTIRYGYVLFAFKYRYLSSKMNSSILLCTFCMYTEAGRMIITFLFRMLPRLFSLLFCVQCKKLNAISQCFFFAFLMWCDDDVWCVMYIYFSRLTTIPINLQCR